MDNFYTPYFIIVLWGLIASLKYATMKLNLKNNLKTMQHFKVEIRETCKVCGSPITNKRSRSYCSTPCRNKFYNQKNRDYQTTWQRERNNKKAEKPSANKLKCEICGRYYVQVGSHIVQAHKIIARQYREAYGFDVKRGQLPEWYRKLKADICKQNGTIKNLEGGAKFRFKPGQKGLGQYERSEETKGRLKYLRKFNKSKK